MYKKFKNYIIGGALASTEDIFERSKIELTFNLTLSFVILYTIMIANIGNLGASLEFKLVHYISYICFFGIFFVFRITKSVLWTGLSFWGIGFFVSTTMQFVGQGQIAGTSIAWHLFGIILALILLPKKIAYLGASYFLLLTLLQFINYFGNLQLFDVGLSTGLKEINDPVGTLIPMVATTYMIAYFINTKNKAQNLIVHQKEKIESSHNELMDSINYAKRIQSAILPSEEIVQKHLPNSFILYKPKDVVAGDFYWVEPTEKGVLFAAADCTGHGVPGAMVSVVCNNGLNRSVREYGLTEPGKILDKTREIILQEFEKSAEEVKDGMDIALCSIEGNEIRYAGAHNPLWIVRGNEIIEIKPDKQPIGKFDKPLPYTTNTFQLQKGDSAYVFSDGFADQFGGERGKKYKASNFKKLILSLQNQPIKQQRKLLNEAFEEWKGSLDQLDDVCVIGVKF